HSFMPWARPAPRPIRPRHRIPTCNSRKRSTSASCSTAKSRSCSTPRKCSSRQAIPWCSAAPITPGATARAGRAPSRFLRTTVAAPSVLIAGPGHERRFSEQRDLRARRANLVVHGPYGRLRAVVRAYFAQDGLHVNLHGGLGNADPSRDDLVGFAFDQAKENG